MSNGVKRVRTKQYCVTLFKLNIIFRQAKYQLKQSIDNMQFVENIDMDNDNLISWERFFDIVSKTLCELKKSLRNFLEK